MGSRRPDAGQFGADFPATKACIDHILRAFKSQTKRYARQEGKDLTYANYFKRQGAIAPIFEARLPGAIKRLGRMAMKN